MLEWPEEAQLLSAECPVTISVLSQIEVLEWPEEAQPLSAVCPVQIGYSPHGQDFSGKSFGILLHLHNFFARLTNY